MVAHGALELQGVAGVQIDVARPVPEVFEAGLNGGVLLVEAVVAVAEIGPHRLLLEVVVGEMVELPRLGVDVLRMAVDGEAVLRLGNLDERPVGGPHVASVGVAAGLLPVASDEVAHGGRPFGREEAVEHFGIVVQRFHAKGAVAVVGVVVIVRIGEPGREAGAVAGGLVRELPIVAGGEVEAGCLLPAGHGVEHIAVGKEVGGGASPLVVGVGVGGIHIAFQLETVALVVDTVVESAPLRGRQSARRVEIAPSAVAVGLAAVVHIVEVAIHAQTRLWRETQGEEAPQIAFLRAVAPLRVANPADGILAFELDVHHQLAFIHLAAQKFAGFALLIVHLHPVHHVGGQVVEQHGVVVLEEVAPVEQEALHLLAVDEYLAVGSELCPRQLADEAVEHRAFLKLEGIGIVDKGVALAVELDLGGRHLGFAQLVGLIGCGGAAKSYLFIRFSVFLTPI